MTNQQKPTRITYSGLFGNIFPTDLEAKRARDEAYFKARKEGKIARRSILKNQLKKYDSLGVPNGNSCDIYELTIEGYD